MKQILIHNATVVNEGQSTQQSILIEEGIIKSILPVGNKEEVEVEHCIDATGLYLLPGVIDDHVHFRDPGLTQKGDITSESKAAVAGGVTSIMDMPNTSPQTTTITALEEKFKLMGEKCLVNYSAYFGATNQNIDQLPLLDSKSVCGVKVFMGASTGNMLVDRIQVLQQIFENSPLLIATHCENQDSIRKNTTLYKDQYNGAEDLPIKYHPLIRSEEACYQSSELAVKLAKESGARLHLLHLSTAKELNLLEQKPLREKQITAEVCIGHLLFSDDDYENMGTKIKCNPSIKTKEDRKALRIGVVNGLIDVIATDHAPHLPKDKEGGALKAASGIPTIQFSLVSMLELSDENHFSIETVVEKMCHAPATIYNINNRGFIREGYHADLVLIKPNSPWTVKNEDIQSSCKWSPFEGKTWNWQIINTFINGSLVYNQGEINEDSRGQQIKFK